MPHDREPLPDIPVTSAPSQFGDTTECEICGAATLTWRNCKLICLSCRSIVKSCADL
jgi:hypothetical protein